MIPDRRMYDTSSSSCSESEDEEDSSRLSQKLQEIPSLARVKDILPIEEAGNAARISDVANRRQESARIERINVEKEATRKQIQKQTNNLYLTIVP